MLIASLQLSQRTKHKQAPKSDCRTKHAPMSRFGQPRCQIDTSLQLVHQPGTWAGLKRVCVGARSMLHAASRIVRTELSESPLVYNTSFSSRRTEKNTLTWIGFKQTNLNVVSAPANVAIHTFVSSVQAPKLDEPVALSRAALSPSARTWLA